MISVHNRSSAESTIEAMSDSDDDEITAAIFATKSTMLAMIFILACQQCGIEFGILTLMAHLALFASFRRFFCS
jgi:hypothetical protein